MVKLGFAGVHIIFLISAQKYTYIILTTLNPTLYDKIGVYMGLHYFFLISART